MCIAQQIEDKNVAVQTQKTRLFVPMSKPPSSRFHSSTRTIHTQSFLRPTTQGMPQQKNPIPTDSKTTTHTSSFRQLTEAKMQEKRRKGLCFCYDEKFGPGHRYEWKELQILWVLDEEELVGGGEHEIPS